MGANTDIIIKNNDNNKRFYFRGVTPFKDRIAQPVLNIPLVNTTAANTFLFRFFGQTEEVSFNFALFDDGTDVSLGDGINTVTEQIAYLKDYIYGDNFDVDWDLWDAYDVIIPSTAAITGVITELSFDKNAGAMTVVTGTLTFMRGNIGSI